MIAVRSPALFLGGALVLVVVAVAVLAPQLAGPDPTALSLRQALAPSSAQALLGRDALGRDVFARVLFGGRVSLLIGISVVAISVLVGVALGALAGFRGGWVDEVVMRSVDILLAFPGLLLAISLAAVLGPSARNTVLALCATSWTSYARVVRGEVLAWRGRELTVAATALGGSPWRVVTRHVLPQLLPPLAIQGAAGIAGAIVAEASLAFLGIGVPPPTPTWGSMINEARGFLLVAPHLAVAPGVALTVTVLGFTLLGDGLRDYFDVKTSLTVSEPPNSPQPVVAGGAR